MSSFSTPDASIYFCNVILFSVSVPVLSVHKISIAPKFSIASIFFTRVFFLASALLPFVKFTFKIIGNILGVIPTATERANSNASLIFFFIMPSITITTKQTTIIYFINKLEILLIPLSKLVISPLTLTSLPTCPRYVFTPVDITIPVALPLSIVDPIKQILSISNI